MNTTRIFLDWNAPLTRRVRKTLIPEEPSGPVDLGSDLIIVPTRQAGRRLREALAHYCASKGTALLEPHVHTPAFFLHAGESINLATPTEVAAMWASLLMHVELKTLAGLFPSEVPGQDFAWASATGKMIQQLRNELADGAYRITDVYHNFGDVLEEPQRWRDLAHLETEYLKKMGQSGRKDPIDAMIAQAESPQLPAKIRRVTIAAVPDPTPLMIKALENINLPIRILVHAPESMANNFDPWGRPIPEKWLGAEINIPGVEANIILAGSPVEQSRKVVEVIAAEQNHFGPADIAIGMPDPSVTPYLSAELESRGLTPFDPAGKPFKSHPLIQLLESFQQLVSEGSYKPFSSLVRHSDILAQTGIDSAKTLEELDHFQNDHLPLGWNYIHSWFDNDGSKRYSHLKEAVNLISEMMNIFNKNDLAVSIREMLQNIYRERFLDPQSTEDAEFTEVAQGITTALDEVESEAVVTLELSKKELFGLLMGRLSEQRYTIEGEGSVIDLEGWLELPWNDAPLLVVTGMNEGMVPKSKPGDLFLPDSLRSELNLRDDAKLTSVDIYLTNEIIGSRKKNGRACFISGKTSAEGEPLKPSRLLLRCADEELPRRTELLFGEVSKDSRNIPPTISFKLNIGAELAPVEPIQKLSVTQFRDYLGCPFRFYLKHVLKMESLDDQKQEMDVMDFGSLVHYALHRMAQHHQINRCEDETQLGNFLSTEAANRIKKDYGSAPPLQVEIQLHAAKERLAAAARVQAELVRNGWEIVASERDFQTEIEGIKISGRIDRIDRHRETGRIRIIDYKTSDKAAKPEDVHLLPRSAEVPDFAKVFPGEKEKRWGDLQLPLYLMMIREEFEGPSELGYFNLPKAVTETGIILWDDLSPQLMESAMACAEGVVRSVTGGIFWPPATKVSFDDFAHLFPADIQKCVEFNLERRR